LAEAGLDSLPTERPEIRAEEHASRNFCWASLVAATIHPVKVAIIEALLWVHVPLSGTELAEIFGNGDYNLDIVLYHLRGLVRLGLIEVTDTRRARGARERYFFFR
jgi:DNA-binding transcriptional ArsR family regulator